MFLLIAVEKLEGSLVFFPNLYCTPTQGSLQLICLSPIACASVLRVGDLRSFLDISTFYFGGFVHARE